MTYVMSDLHGMYRLYLKMLKKIGFGDGDRLYILGDICDRGDEPAEIYLDVAKRENVFCLKGNHETILEEYLPLVFGHLTGDENAPDTYVESDYWVENGGDSTMRSLLRHGKKGIRLIYELISKMPYTERVEVGDKVFHLAHAGGYVDGGQKDLSGFSEYELVWDSPSFDSVFGDAERDVLIVGHTPTLLLDYSGEGHIYFGRGNIIDIDCGAVFTGSRGRLGCLRLDDMKEFYVK